MTKNLVIYEKTLEMIEYGTIALRQFPRYEKFVLAAMIRQQMYQVLKLIVETNKRTYRKTALTELDISHETLRHLVDLAYRRRIRSWLGHCRHADARAITSEVLAGAVFSRAGKEIEER